MNPSARSKTRWKLPYLRNELLKYTSRKLPLQFIAITETWLKSYITDGQIDIEHYNVSRSDRSTRTGRGGVLLYSHESVPITDVQKYEVEVYLGFNPCQPITTASPQFKDLSFRSLD